MNKTDLKNLFNAKMVKFTYVKANGDVRVAVGTTNKDIMSLFIELKDNGQSKRKENVEYFCYFDLSRLAFRQFKISKLVSIECVYNDFAVAAMNALGVAMVFSDFSIEDYSSLSGEFFRVFENAGKTDLYSKIHARIFDVCNASSNVAEDLKKLDHDIEWCVMHNNARGLNGVMLAAGDVISSGFDCFGNPIVPKGANAPIQHKVEVEYTTTKKPYVTESKEDIILAISKKHEELAELYRKLSAFA